MSKDKVFTQVDEQYAPIFAEIWKILDTTYTPDGKLIWLNKRNEHLGMQKPIDLVNLGAGLKVREAAYALDPPPPPAPKEKKG
jgi:hypothetical protein